MALTRGSIEAIVERDGGGDPNAYRSRTGRGLIHQLAVLGDAELLHWFIVRYSPDLNLCVPTTGWNALLCCNSFRCIQILVDAGIDIHNRSAYFYENAPAVCFFAYHGRRQSLDLLLERGANPYHARRGHEMGYNRTPEIAALIRCYELRWNHCRTAVHALLVLKKRRALAKWPGDMLYLLARIVWSTRANEGWNIM